MKQFRIIIAAALVSSMVVGLGIASSWATNKVAELCQPTLEKQYGFECETAELILLPTPRILVTDFKASLGKENNSLWDIRLDHIEGFISASSLFKVRPIFDNLLLENLEVLLTETTPVVKDSTSKNARAKRPKIEVHSLAITNGSFTYIDRDRKKQRADATIAFTDIGLQANDILFADDILKDIRLELSGQLNHGRIGLKIELKAPLSNPDIQIHANIDNIPLSAVNSYTKPTEGMTLSGEVINAIGHSHIKDREVESSVKIQYSDLDIVIDNNDDRTGIEAWLAEAYLDIKICDQKQKNLKSADYTHSLYHKGEQSWVQFYLMGLLKSALSAACFEDAI